VSSRTQLHDPSPLLSRNMNLIISLLRPGGNCRRHSVHFLTSVEGVSQSSLKHKAWFMSY